MDELRFGPPQETVPRRFDLLRVVIHAHDAAAVREHGEHVAQRSVSAAEVHDGPFARHDAVEERVALLQPYLDPHVPLQHGAFVGVAFDEHVAEIGVAGPVVGLVEFAVLAAHLAACGLGLRGVVRGVAAGRARQYAAHDQSVLDVDGLAFGRDHAVAVEAYRQDVQS